MAIINQSKPTETQGTSYLNIGGGFNLLVGGGFKLIITPASTAGLITNKSKASVGETWATISTTWATETRTWLGVSKLISNSTKQSSSVINVSKPV